MPRPPLPVRCTALGQAYVNPLTGDTVRCTRVDQQRNVFLALHKMKGELGRRLPSEQVEVVGHVDTNIPSLEA